MRCELTIPVIAGGMVTTAQEVNQALQAGAAAVSTTVPNSGIKISHYANVNIYITRYIH